PMLLVPGGQASRGDHLLERGWGVQKPLNAPGGQHERVIAGRNIPFLQQPVLQISVRLDAQEEHEREDPLFAKDRRHYLIRLYALEQRLLRFFRGVERIVEDDLATESRLGQITTAIVEPLQLEAHVEIVEHLL